MCGIAGFLELARPRPRAEAAALVGAMGAAIAHRGPDGAGVWVSPDGACALAHRRLAIVELSAAGAQPMTSPSGRYVVTFNGEIYNHRELRAELTGVRWRGHSDTEVMLAAFDRDGVIATLPRLIGMFALAVWDTYERTLTLARDRLGEKPLYWGRLGDGVGFASELKALRVHPGFAPTIDRGAFVQFIRHGYVPAPRSIYAGLGKLAAGSYVVLGREPDPTPRRYYDLVEVARRGVAAPLEVTAAEAADRVDAALRVAVARQAEADVPVGAFLSGGVDSSLVAAVMAAVAPGRVRTFHIGFHETSHDESSYAAAIARRLGVEHTMLVATPSACLPIVHELPRIYDEPFADSSQLPTTLLARLTRDHVTVALSGDGGDELFGGYHHYALLRQVARLYAVPGRRLVARTTLASLGRAAALAPAGSRARLAIEWLRRRVFFAAADDLDAFYRAAMSIWAEPELVAPGLAEPAGLLPLAPDVLRASPVERAMLADALLFLPDDIMAKVDRATMSVALESRAPFLDPGVVELAWRLPYARRVGDGPGKAALRGALARYLPPAMFERPKRGFAVPLGGWLRGPLRDWAEALLAPTALAADGLLDVAVIRSRWEEHLRGQRDWHAWLWIILVWQAWRAANGTAARGVAA
ncbi:MAG: asparagine synthase (glutamine-hydrolyzing) [Kofleriaceae bacterium]|nr:asparagine synthase (glutamine-hydrolyzing) [Kofleriaceae bacterium]MBP9167546.1 asparagine synthase (glutamine-hydrolyzing) [Kofleriaceae bacterium]MBP9856627.1 asparagine synthase (glutamine-hydrolyzing) [Kofleriaceae bacterium]